MEHTASHRAIQGGGSGSGLNVPPQITRDEPVLERKIVQDSINIANQHEALFENRDTPRMSIWMEHLKNRYFVLSQRRRSYQAGLQIRSSQRTPTSTHTPSSEDRLECPPISNTDGHVDTRLQQHITFNLPVLQENTVSTQSTLPHHVKYIPGLPRTLPELLKLWRFGSDTFKPVRLFDKASKRRTLVSNYTNASWARGGQKHAYLRFRDIVLYVHEHAPIVCNVWEEGNDRHWDTAVDNFYAEVGSEFSTKTQSALLKYIRQKRN